MQTLTRIRRWIVPKRSGEDPQPPPRSILTQDEFDAWERLPPVQLPEGYKPMSTQPAEPEEQEQPEPE